MEDLTQRIEPYGTQPTQQISPFGERTQQVGAGAPTVMGAPMRALQMECLLGRDLGNAYGGREHLLVEITGTSAGVGRRLPLNLCLVIDRSGSMEGEPIDYVKRACGYVVDLLDQNDILSIITFSDTVDVVMPARRVVNKTLIKEHIQRIEIGNTTNLYDGMLVGCQQVAAVMSEQVLTRVLVFTDGEPTSGIKDFASIVQLAADQKARGITITVLGFGPEFNEELLAGIARRSGGNYYYIQRPELIPEVFRRELELLMTVVAKNVRLILTLPRFTQIRQVYGAQPSVQGRVVEIPQVDIERGAVVTQLVEFDLQMRPPGKYRVAKVALAYDDTITGRVERIEADAVMEFTQDVSRISQTIHPRVQREIEIQQLSRNLERTVMGLKTQQLSAAEVRQELERTMAMLTRQGRLQEAQEIQQALAALGSDTTVVEKTLMGTAYSLEVGKSKQP
jgi:Ca-activated chloride channel family protein